MVIQLIIFKVFLTLATVTQRLNNNKMNIISSNSIKNVVSLKELVPQHDCLKLLILHTPYTLVIDTLHLCINLVKLDLSKNNLQHFPYMGDLSNLKFMFIHENKLDVVQLRNIFEKNGKKSNLSENVVWVTFWGNKNSYLGRHYLVNQTNVIAVDKNMVVQQQRWPDIPYNENFQSFCHETDISEYLNKKNTANRHTSQQQYMKELWVQMSALRKKHEQLFPIIKIQKIFRGYMLRSHLNNNKYLKKQKNTILMSYLTEWKRYIDKRKKLKKLLKTNRKQYLLLEHKEMNKQWINYRLIQIARECKKKVFSKRFSLKYQMKFYHSLRQNVLKLNSLYTALHLEHSSAIYVYKNHWETFRVCIIPFLKLFSSEIVVPKKNQSFNLHFLYQFYANTSQQFIRILQTNFKSVVYLENSNKNTNNPKRARKNLLYGCHLKQIYGKFHFSTIKQFEMKQKFQNLQNKSKLALEQLIKIQGSTTLLKQIARGVYFYNLNVLKVQTHQFERIHIFSQFMLKRVTSAIKIQKVWRGYLFRKNNYVNLRKLLEMQRAATIIQRWLRKLPNIQKKHFLHYATKNLIETQQNVFYMNIQDYLSLLQAQRYKKARGIQFQEQDTALYQNCQNNTLALCWNFKSSKHQTLQNIRLKKIPFNTPFLKEKLHLTHEQIQSQSVLDLNKHKICNLSFIFHYGTQSSVFSKNKQKYLQIKCSSKNDAKFRTFVLMLMTYKIADKRGVKLVNPKIFSVQDIVNKKQICKRQMNFICNQNYNIIKICQLKFHKQPNVNLHVINNKFYMQSSQSKPLKVQQKLFIYTQAYEQKVEVKVQNETRPVNRQYNEHRRYKTQYINEYHNNFLTEPSNQDQQQENFNKIKMKSFIKKRSVKNFKIQKKSKNKRTQYPSFVLDSLSINERLTTQPDYLVTQVSNQENNSIDQNVGLQTATFHAQKNQIKIKQRSTIAEKRTNAFKKKQMQNFTKKFVNLGNFIQNQYANDYRRRIKTEIQTTNAQSADNVKRSIERSQSQRIQDMQQNYRKIRQKHSQHRQLIQKTQALTREYSVQLKNQAFEERERKIKQKSKLKRLKVSFAEQCYPLAARNKKQQHFPI